MTTAAPLPPDVPLHESPRLPVATVGADHVATVTWEYPPHNFVDDAFVVALTDVLAELERGRSVRAIVLAPGGRHFCAGWDHTTPSAATPSDRYHPVDTYIELLTGTKPRVAAVHGAAIGGGLGLALAADFRVTCEEARLSANFATLGFFQGSAMTITLPHVVGAQQALRLLGTAPRLSGTAATALGLCDQLVRRPDVAGAAHRLAAELAAVAPLALTSIRATMRAHLVAELPAALAHEAANQRVLHDTRDFAEGVAASQARRRPAFTGR